MPKAGPTRFGSIRHAAEKPLQAGHVVVKLVGEELAVRLDEPRSARCARAEFEGGRGGPSSSIERGPNLGVRAQHPAQRLLGGQVHDASLYLIGCRRPGARG